jgi:hypothetical protein
VVERVEKHSSSKVSCELDKSVDDHQSAMVQLPKDEFHLSVLARVIWEVA